MSATSAGRIALTGSSGLVGKFLAAAMSENGFRIVRLARDEALRDPGAGVFFWDPAARRMDPGSLSGVDAVIHLAGESVAKGRWTQEKKQAILNSRIEGARFLCEKLREAEAKGVKTALFASSAGIYGHRGPYETLNEASQPGEGFLASVACKAEAAARSLLAPTVRGVFLRFGVVVSPSGGAAAFSPPGPVQDWHGRLDDAALIRSWIALAEIPPIVEFILNSSRMEGAVNVTSPESLPNDRFAEILRDSLGRKTVFDMTREEAVRRFGEMAGELIFRGGRVAPRALLNHGYRFRFPSLGQGLTRMLQEGGASGVREV